MGLSVMPLGTRPPWVTTKMVLGLQVDFLFAETMEGEISLSWFRWPCLQGNDRARWDQIIWAAQMSFACLHSPKNLEVPERGFCFYISQNTYSKPSQVGVQGSGNKIPRKAV